MAIADTIFTYTSGVAGVTALLGSGTNCKLYWEDVQDKAAAPYAIFLQTAESQAHRFGGKPTVSELTIKVESYAITPQLAQSIDKAIYDAWMGNEVLFTGGVTVKAILHRNRVNAGYNDAVGLYAMESEFMFWVDL